MKLEIWTKITSTNWKISHEFVCEVAEETFIKKTQKQLKMLCSNICYFIAEVST